MTFAGPGIGQTFRDIVEVAWGSTSASDLTVANWTDISSRVRGTITITKGKANLSGTADPTMISCVLDNNDDALSPLNPLSIYWPNVVRNVPIRVRRTWSGATTSYERATAFVNGWPVSPNAGMLDVTIPITATGRLRRLRRSGKTVGSALSMAVSATSPALWWPMEDGTQAIQLASGLPGGKALVSGGNVTTGAAGAPGSAASVDFSGGGQITGTMPNTLSSTEVHFGFAFQPNDTNGQTYNALKFNAGNGVTWLFSPTTGTTGGLTVSCSSPGGLFSGSMLPNAFWAPGSWHWVEVDLKQNGANVDITATVDDVVTSGPGLFTGVTLGQPNQIILGPSTSINGGVVATSTKFAMTSLAFWSSPPAADIYPAVSGYAGETAAARSARVCAAVGIPITVITGTVPSQAMGPQLPDTVANILGSCEDIDNGLLHDGGALGNLVFVSGASLYNAAPELALDYKRSQISDGFDGTFDDQDLVNEWTISRTSGSSATSSNAASLAVDDDYDQQDTVNVAADNQCQLVADWRTHVDSYETMRFPGVGIDLRRSPELVQQVTLMTLPVYISLLNLPTPTYPYGNNDQFGIGYTETLDAVTWQITFNATPAAPYRVAGLQDPTNPFVLDCMSTLQTGINATVLSMQVATPSGPLLSTSGADYPVDVYLDGEQITISSVSGASSPQTAVIKRSINGVVKSHTAGQSISVYRPAAIAL